MTINTTIRSIASRRRAPAESAPVAASGEVAQCKTVCSNCNLREVCVPCCELTRSEMDRADLLVFNRVQVRRGDNLYRTGDRFGSLYAVRNGFFKSVGVLENGREQVTGFSMVGEILGMDGIGSGEHAFDTVALEDSEVCAIPFTGLQELAQEIPALQRHFYKMMSREIERDHGVILHLGSMTADERLAMFLLDLSRRFAARGYSATEFNLRMTREEIGSYLGLKLETVSRTFSRFQDQGLIGVQLKFIRIRNSRALEQVMGRDSA